MTRIAEYLVGQDWIMASQKVDIGDGQDKEWIDDRSKPEVDFEDEQQQSHEQELNNLRVLEWLNEMTSDPKKTSVTTQDVDREGVKYIKNDKDNPSWAAKEGTLFNPASNLNLISAM